MHGAPVRGVFGRGPFYHVSSAWWIRGTLDVAALRAALDTVQWRHESLRTSFPGQRSCSKREDRILAHLALL